MVGRSNLATAQPWMVSGPGICVAEHVLLHYAVLLFAQIQKLHDQYIAEVDKLRKVKDAELREHRD